MMGHFKDSSQYPLIHQWHAIGSELASLSPALEVDASMPRQDDLHWGE